MNNEHDAIDNLADLESFLLSVENGGFGLQGVAGIGMATNTKDGRHFVAVFDDNQSLLLARYVTDEVYKDGKEMVRNGVQTKH
jgi:hypothetical protein